MLEFTPQDAADPSSDVIFDLPYQDRLHTILLRYRDVKNENTGFDICTVLRLQGERDENNCFERAKQTTIIRYIPSRENYDDIIEKETLTVYSRDDNNTVKRDPKRSTNDQQYRLLKYIVNVDHDHRSTSLLDFVTTVHIVPRESLDTQE
jgi:hypothetical protein